MAKRKKRKPASRHNNSVPLPGWVWMLFGLGVGLSVAAAIYVGDRRKSPLPTTGQPQASAQQVQPAPKPRRKVDTGNRFEFYEMLPKFEVVIPEEDIEAKPDVSAKPVAEPGLYVLQAGSFSTNNDADRMKAQIALLGIVSRIQKVAVDEKVYHRVRIGPVVNLDDLNAMRSQLRQAQIEVIVIRVGE